MPPRRSHKKSRNGCDQCKKRRVKCDEADPCLNCTRRGLACSYPPLIAAPRLSNKNKHFEQRIDPCTPPSNNSLAEISARTDAALNIFQSSLAHTACFLREWNGQDPELMHHYCISTCNTFTNQEEVRHVWRTVIPTIAYSYEFLMHGILSLSAMHLSYLKPEKHSHYLTNSTFHMALGLQTFRTILRKPTEENCLALFSFSSLLIVWTGAAPTDSKDAQPLSSVIEMFNLCRGVSTLADFMPLIRKSPLGPLVDQDWSEKPGTPFRLFRGLGGQITALRYRLTVETFGEEEKPVFENAVTELENTCQRIEHADPCARIGMIYVWPLMIRNKFVTLIEQRHPFALILLACYCVQLHVFRDFWFVGRRAESLLSEISELIPSGYADLLEWPRQFCSYSADLGRWSVLHPGAVSL
ncbi:hypothetical protein ETB97_006406 [Aspergillus alliaceus]|uniref:Zn(2)-C6 fungal-type domain-containing protein n=1 Tax=Petromyces alliaceus TaxID=209559 RepID=A0A5N7BRY1_PETAA|nr:hypothetical protein BDV23DRAFT_166496 [Aspergillus alliaceus]KAF5857015.1 hypothetical protein ETB97_006406 [Aspergillus burnettii]